MGWFRKINKNGEDYKPIGNVITATSLSVTGPALAAGDVVRVMFTTDIAGSDTSTPLALTWNGGGSPIPVKVAKEGSLAGVYAKEVATNIFKYISGYVTLELAFDGTNLVIVGNPVVLSGAGYTIYADGYDEIGWNELSDFENVEIEYKDNSSVNITSVVPTQFTKMDYDGVLLINSRFQGNDGIMGCYLKNFGYVGFINTYGGHGTPEYKTLTVSVKKNDEICLVFHGRRTDYSPYTFNGSPYILGRFYKNRT